MTINDFPKTMPRWNDKYPCPTSITLYLSAVAMRKVFKKFPMPDFPNFNKIFKEYNDAQQ